MTEETKCSHCGTPLSIGGRGNLCPKCLLARGLEPNTAGFTADGPEASPRWAPPKPEELAARFPELEILELIGRGGMGAVYKARQKNLERLVALKILPPEIGRDPAFAERFAREAQALARLSHPHIVAIHDFGERDGLFFFLMEYMDGLNLRQLMASGNVSPKEALAIVPQICDALQFAHDQGIVHRDIKPENILLDRRGQVKIADFGLAKLTGRPAAAATDEQVMGTPQYMAPEQTDHPSEVDHRADIYSLGVVFYQMLTGELPDKRLEPPSKKVVIDVRLDEVVLRALEKEPERRYQQASVLKTEVETIAATPPANAETLASEILARDYDLDIGSCLRRGWALVRGSFWPVMGTSAIVLLLLQVGVLAGPLVGGLCLYFLKKIRGEPARVETAFSGFSIALLQLFLVGLVGVVLTLVGLGCLILPGVYLAGAATLALALVIDKRLDFWPAIKLSHKAIFRHWGKFLGLLVVLALINLAGALAFGVGVFVAFPVALAALMYAYEDIFGPAKRGVNEPVGAPTSAGWESPPSTPPGSATGGTGRPPRFSRTAIVGACWAALSLIFVIQMAMAQTMSPSQIGSSPWWYVLGFLDQRLLALTAPIGVTVLGFIALSQIRRSAGRLRGLGLALFDALLFPLLALDGAFCTLISAVRLFTNFYANLSVQGNPQIHPALVTRIANVFAQSELAVPILVLVVIVMAIVADVLIIRWAWRAAKKPVGGPQPLPAAPPAAGAKRTWLAPVLWMVAPVAVVLVLLVGIALLGTLWGIYEGLHRPAVTREQQAADSATKMANAMGPLDVTTDMPPRWVCRARVAEAEIADVEVGQDVRMVLDAFPGRKFQGKVAQVGKAPAKDPNQVLYETTIDIADPDPRFKVGMSVNAWVIVAHRKEVPKTSRAAKASPAGESKPSFEEASAAALQVIKSRAVWPQSPEALCKEFWAARARKDYEELKVLWPGSASFDWEAVCRQDANVKYVFGTWDGQVVSYATEEYYRQSGAYNMKMLLGSIETAKGKRYYVISGN